jgi:hypothetical protein
MSPRAAMTVSFASGCVASLPNAGGSAIERLHILLQREGIKLNHKKLFRIYQEERLTVRRRGGRKRALGHASANDPAAAGQPALEPRLRF